MARLLNIDLLKRARASSVLGLNLDGTRLDGAVLRRTNGSVQVLQSFTANLSLNPLTTGSELVGREIRNCLDNAGIRERVCVVGLPLGWILTAHIEIPELSADDADNLLAIEAERAFPCEPSSLQIVGIKAAASAGKTSALLAGVPKANVELLANALRAAKLHPVSFSLGLAAQHPADSDSANGVVCLSIGENTVGLQVTGRGGILALRALEGAIDQEGGRKVLNTATISRETRITLGQIPPTQRENIRQIRILGPEDLGRHLADELELRTEVIGMEAEAASRSSLIEHGLKVPSGTPLSAPISLAAQYLSGKKAAFEFLPPYVSPWQRISKKYASGRLRIAAASAAAILVSAGALFGYQQYRLMRLESRWAAMSSRVKEIESVQERIRQFRPWYDDKLSSLTILKQLSTAFPAEGIVNARSVEVRNSEVVTCTGTARDNRSLLATLDKLRAFDGVSEIKVSQLRGRSPTQFTFDFRWQAPEESTR